MASSETGSSVNSRAENVVRITSYSSTGRISSLGFRCQVRESYALTDTVSLERC